MSIILACADARHIPLPDESVQCVVVINGYGSVYLTQGGGRLARRDQLVLEICLYCIGLNL